MIERDPKDHEENKLYEHSRQEENEEDELEITPYIQDDQLNEASSICNNNQENQNFCLVLEQFYYYLF